MRGQIADGGRLEAGVRALVYITMGQRTLDGRTFMVLKELLDRYPDVDLQCFKQVLRLQWAALTIDQEAALAALPDLLPDSAVERDQLLANLEACATAAGPRTGEAARRFDEIKALASRSKRQGDNVTELHPTG